MKYWKWLLIIYALVGLTCFGMVKRPEFFTNQNFFMASMILCPAIAVATTIVGVWHIWNNKKEKHIG